MGWDWETRLPPPLPTSGSSASSSSKWVGIGKLDYHHPCPVPSSGSSGNFHHLDRSTPPIIHLGALTLRESEGIKWKGSYKAENEQMSVLPLHIRKSLSKLTFIFSLFIFPIFLHFHLHFFSCFPNTCACIDPASTENTNYMFFNRPLNICSTIVNHVVCV